MNEPLVGLELPALLHVEVRQPEQILGIHWDERVVLVIPAVPALVVGGGITNDRRELEVAGT